MPSIVIFLRTNASVSGLGEADYGNVSPKSKASSKVLINFINIQYFRECSENIQ